MAIQEVVDWSIETKGNQAVHPTSPEGERATRISSSFQELQAAIARWRDGLASSPLSTKGDIYTYDTDDQRLAVGTNGQLLSADSTQATGLKWVDEPASGFPSGTLMLFQQTAAPTGWTKETTHNDKALRVVTGTAGSGGTTAFSTVHVSNRATTLEGAHTHTTLIPATGWTGGTFATARAFYAANQANRVANRNLTSGGGSNHSHTVDLAVQYVDLIIASKD